MYKNHESHNSCIELEVLYDCFSAPLTKKRKKKTDLEIREFQYLGEKNKEMKELQTES